MQLITTTDQNPRPLQQGQMLIMLIIYMVVAVIITTASVSMLVITSQSADKLSQGSNALDIAESGAETAMIKLLRDPAYTGETFAISDGQAIVTVTGTNPKVIVSEGIRGNFRRKIQVSADYTNNVLTVSSWQELP